MTAPITVNGAPLPVDSAYRAKLAALPPVDPAPLTEALELIENGEEFRKAREHLRTIEGENHV